MLHVSVKESLIVDASNRFFTVIPSIHPHVIQDEDDFKSKVEIAILDPFLIPRIFNLVVFTAPFFKNTALMQIGDDFPSSIFQSVYHFWLV